MVMEIEMDVVKTTVEYASGYAHSGYARSLAEFGVPSPLRHSRGWVLERAIPGSSYNDAIGCYPLFSCGNWSKLALDIQGLHHGWISLAIVTDPFGEYDRALLDDCFRDVVKPFKEHHCVDLRLRPQEHISKHHQRNARKALKLLDVDICHNWREAVDEWTDLYAHLVRRHSIKGFAAFSRQAFLEQFQVPGLIGLRARYKDVTAGMILLYVRNDVAFYHLGAYNPLGYETNASFALFWRAIEYAKSLGLKWLELGGGSGCPLQQDRRLESI